MHSTWCWLLTCLFCVAAQIQHFVTRPYDQAVSIHIEYETNLSRKASLAPGYYFLTPYLSDWKAGNFGPQIFDAEGTLIWYGNHSVGVRAIDAHACSFRSSTNDHICFNDAPTVEQGGHSSGVIRILDNTYKEVFTTEATNNLRGPDVHELNIPRVSRGRTLIKDVYHVVRANLSIYDSFEDGHVLNGCFQEINVPSGSLVFQWCSLDHISLNETYVFTRQSKHQQYTHPIAGFGGPNMPWDYFHINSVDKDDYGDFVVSGRHTNAIYKIAGLTSPSRLAPGSVIWRLNGKHSDFLMYGNGFHSASFARQHHVRFVPTYKHPHSGAIYTTNSSHTVLSLFDNASDGFYHSSEPCSSAKILLLTAGPSLGSMPNTATLLHYVAQPSGWTSSSQGSVSILPNGNTLIGWGSTPRYSEHAPDGSLLYYASFGKDLQNYRVSKAEWTGRPATRPDIVAYAQYCGAESHVYVSWNGATEVAAWRFYASDETQTLDAGRDRDDQRPFYELRGAPLPGRVSPLQMQENIPATPRTGFETHIVLSPPVFFRQVYAVALDADGITLGRTLTVGLFVPSADMACGRQRCDDWAFDYIKSSNSTLAGCVGL